MDTKQQTIKLLAEFLTRDVVQKSVTLEVESSRPKQFDGLMPKMATEWFELREALGIRGYVDAEWAEERLTAMLS